jgi:hypothetical protein
MLGLLAVMLATAAWGVDNTLSRTVAERDPSQVVIPKGALVAVATTLLAFLFGEPLPALGLLVVGATRYGLSLRFYLLAQRSFGAARTGSVFAFAPFVGGGVGFRDRRGQRQRVDACRCSAEGGRHRAALGRAPRASSWPRHWLALRHPGWSQGSSPTSASLSTAAVRKTPRAANPSALGQHPIAAITSSLR